MSDEQGPTHPSPGEGGSGDGSHIEDRTTDPLRSRFKWERIYVDKKGEPANLFDPNAGKGSWEMPTISPRVGVIAVVSLLVLFGGLGLLQSLGHRTQDPKPVRVALRESMEAPKPIRVAKVEKPKLKREQQARATAKHESWLSGFFKSAKPSAASAPAATDFGTYAAARAATSSAPKPYREALAFASVTAKKGDSLYAIGLANRASARAIGLANYHDRLRFANAHCSKAPKKKHVSYCN
ncbi:MAG: hypothetical protein AAB901_02570, partial [Patescibacteria group bacterium]